MTLLLAYSIGICRPPPTSPFGHFSYPSPSKDTSIMYSPIQDPTKDTFGFESITLREQDVNEGRNTAAVRNTLTPYSFYNGGGTHL